MRALFHYADNRLPDSLANKFRRRRTRVFEALCDSLPRPLRILDVGGVEHFWRFTGLADSSDVEIVLLNREPLRPTAANISAVVGDAREMADLDEDEFPVVFSNSVIEHVGAWSDQMSMAREIRRVGARYFVQTPNRNFPVEPHFLFPGFQFLPISARVALVRRLALGYHPVLRDPEEAHQAVTEIRLLSGNDLGKLFPGADLYRERILGMTKSFVVCGGWKR
jgi:hypothetical protein